MTWDRRRLLHAAVLFAWAGFFLWLWRSGAATTYIGSRTSWVVPFGAAGFTVCGLARLASARHRGRPARVTVREAAGNAFFVAPLVAVLLVPSPQLGANAADRKSAVKARIRAADLPAPDTAAGGPRPITMLEIVGGNVDPETRRAVDAHSGRPARVDGVVTKVRRNAIDVTRFQIYCCAADAVPFTVTVEQRGIGRRFAKNQWVAADGVLRDSGDQIYVVAARTVRREPEPANPYLE
jgi:uncharacterized repeat protein (TIGR03943 family)